MADIFDVLADGTRREILQVLLARRDEGDASAQRGASVSEIVAALELSQPTVSKHLKVLREAELVTVREEGQHRFYRLEAEPLEALEDWLIPFLSVDFSLVQEAAGLQGQARQVADTVGKVAADTTHAVSNAVHRVTRRLKSG